jgi:predicted dithiol-disulfide oxidoreductase (DUF899 family)
LFLNISFDTILPLAFDPQVNSRVYGYNRFTSTFKYDLGSEDRDGKQDSTISVFSRANDGTLRHFYSAHPRMAGDIKERGIDLLSPIWNMLDLAPQGRGDWYAKLEYPKLAQRSHG